MNERTARDVVLVRAIEMADGAREVWSDADRAWAGRAAAEIVGEKATDDAFLGRRATLVLERLAERFPKVRALSHMPALRGWLAPVAAGCAFVIGVAGVDLGSGRIINLLAPPVLALLVWNLAVYVALAVATARRPHQAARRPVRRAVVAWFRGLARPVPRKSGVPRALSVALARFATDWSTLALPLWQQRAARLLHAGAAALALGAIAGLYLRGIALEYRAGWQSTFLDATDVARLLHVVLAPGAWLTGIAIPDANHLEAIGGATAGENAAQWIHLYAATILLVVIVPRLMLAGIAFLRERRLSRRFPISVGNAYYQRLLDAWREGTAQVIAQPYSFEVSPAARDGLSKLMARVFESGVDVAWRDSTPYGDDSPPQLSPSGLAAAVAVFNLTATPERDNHGAFIDTLRSAAGHAPLIAIVDISDFVDRFDGDPRRIGERERAWRQMLEAHRIEPLFVRLVDPDLHEAAVMLSSRLEQVTS
jgi:hypothetical protein